MLAQFEPSKRLQYARKNQKSEILKVEVPQGIFNAKKTGGSMLGKTEKQKLWGVPRFRRKERNKKLGTKRRGKNWPRSPETECPLGFSREGGVVGQSKDAQKGRRRDGKRPKSENWPGRVEKY